VITLTIEELAATQKAFGDLPPEMVKEATNIIQGEANYAAYQLKSKYPPGDLQQGVEIEELKKDTAYAGFRIKNTDYKAWWFEYGTAERWTKKRFVAFRGQMPTPRPHGPLVDTLQKARAQMWVLLRDLLVRTGLKVTG